MPLITNTTINSNKLLLETKINHSASFVLSNNCLDKCPKCGQNVCEHTSVADAINLQNSVSQDFSTYSSDSSLIKQLLNDPCSSSNNNKNITNSNSSNNKNAKSTNRISMGAINKLNESFFISQYQKQHLKTCNHCLNNRICFNSNDVNQFMPCFNLRPLSCQVMIIDNETTDKLLKDFFDSQPHRETILAENQNEETVVCTNKCNTSLKSETNNNDTANTNTVSSSTNNNNNNNELPWHSSPKNELINNSINNSSNELKGKEKKKKKFSNFRLFSRNSNSITKTDARKSSPHNNKKAILRSSGLVNCLTSSTSSSSSSCEELRHKLFINKKFKTQQQRFDSQMPQQQEEDDARKSKNQTASSSDTTDNDQTVLYEEETSTDQSNLTIRYQAAKNDSKVSLCKSIMSLNSHTLEEVEAEEEEEDNNDYNEMQNIELCPIVVSDIDEYQEHETNQKENNQDNKKNKKKKSNATHFTNCNNNYNSNNFNNNNIITNHNNTTNINNVSTIISVPLNNYLFYNYEKRNNENSNNNKETKNSTKIFTEQSDTVKTHPTETPIYHTRTETVNSEINRTPIRQPCYTANNSAKKNRRDAPVSKNRLSYFSSCSSTCVDESASTTSGTFDEITKTDCLSDNHHLNDSTTSSSNSSDQFQVPYKYHSISIVFIIMGLFSINFSQEYFVLFYYFNTEQFYWLIYSLIALFSGQTLTLILALLTEIDYINSLSPRLASENAAVNAIYSPSSLSSLPSSKLNDAKQTSKLLADHQPVNETKTNHNNNNNNSKARSHYNQELYLLFKNPFSKIFLLVPGFLPVCVFVQFFKHVFKYRKNSGNQRFKLEFQLSLYLFYNCVFHSLPLAIINSCYFASTTTSHTLSSYYTELLSLFSFSSSSHSTPTTSSSLVFVDDPSLERRNQLVLFLVSIFISISIGICLFTTYFELMKQMNYLSLIRFKNVFYQHISLNNTSRLSKSFNLGLIEILVYFCYKFCLITSRLSIIAIFWYLFHEWLILAILAHLFLTYICIYISTRTKKNTSNTNESNENMLKNSTTESSTTASSSNGQKVHDFKAKDFDLCADSSTISSRLGENGLFTRDAKRSRLSKQLTLFIICLLSGIDLFMNQLSEIYHLKKVIIYYVVYFVQNFTVLTYWLIKSIVSARVQFQNENNSHLLNSFAASATATTTSAPVAVTTSRSSFFILFKSFTTLASRHIKSDFTSSSSSNYSNFTPTQYACYATLIYLFIMLFTIFGLILKFLHLHILRKRYRRLYN